MTTLIFLGGDSSEAKLGLSSSSSSPVEEDGISGCGKEEGVVPVPVPVMDEEELEEEVLTLSALRLRSMFVCGELLVELLGWRRVAEVPLG